MPLPQAIGKYNELQVVATSYYSLFFYINQSFEKEGLQGGSVVISG